MKKVLVAIKNSEDSWKAVDYVARQFSGMNDVEITLFHVLLGLPPEFWDDGHLLTEEEKAVRETVLKKWLTNQEALLEPLFRKGKDMLTGGGIPENQIKTKFVSESFDEVDECVLAEARSGGYGTVVIGRCSRPKHLLLGSVANKILNAGTGLAICVAG